MTNKLPVNLICEEATTDYDVVLDQKSPNEKPMLKIKGPFLIAEKRNGNGRMYTRQILELAVRDYKRDYIDKNIALGEINHPDRSEPDFNEACIKINSIVQSEQNPNVFIGEATVLATNKDQGLIGTPKGDILASLLQYGVKPGVSSRGFGHISKDKVVDKFYKLVAEDVVYNPSGPGCYVDGIYESKQFLVDEHGDIMEMAFDGLDKNLRILPLKESDRVAKIAAAWNTFLNDIKTK